MNSWSQVSFIARQKIGKVDRHFFHFAILFQRLEIIVMPPKISTFNQKTFQKSFKTLGTGQTCWVGRVT